MGAVKSQPVDREAHAESERDPKLMACSHCLEIFYQAELTIEEDFYGPGGHAFSCEECNEKTRGRS